MLATIGRGEPAHEGVAVHDRGTHHAGELAVGASGTGVHDALGKGATVGVEGDGVACTRRRGVAVGGPLGVDRGISGEGRTRGDLVAADGRIEPAREGVTLPAGGGRQAAQVAVGVGRHRGVAGQHAAVGVEGDGVAGHGHLLRRPLCVDGAITVEVGDQELDLGAAARLGKPAGKIVAIASRLHRQACQDMVAIGIGRGDRAVDAGVDTIVQIEADGVLDRGAVIRGPTRVEHGIGSERVADLHEVAGIRIGIPADEVVTALGRRGG